MYKVPTTYDKITGRDTGEIYYDKFAATYRAALERKLMYRSTWSVGVYGHRDANVVMKLLPGSKAESFIKHCIKSDHFMRVLLSGNLRQMSELLQVLRRWIGNVNEIRELSEQDKLNLSQRQKHGLGPICHFQSVIKHVFVDALYDKEVDKTWIVQKKQLKYCPYCGDASVFVTQHVGVGDNNVVAKPFLDHYLPKSKYPYFAVNFYNLFPCCWRCNSNDFKGDKMPIEIDAEGNGHYLIIYPYVFNESLFKFVYVPPTSQNLDDDIKLLCADAYLNEGYNKILGLEALYKNYKNEAKDMFDNASSYLSQPAIDYGRQTYGFDKRFMDFYALITLGFNPKRKNPWDVQRYKFKMDILRQLNQEFKIKM